MFLKNDSVNYDKSCSTNCKFKSNNLKEPLLQTKVPNLLFQLIAMDIAEHKKSRIG